MSFSQLAFCPIKYHAFFVSCRMGVWHAGSFNVALPAGSCKFFNLHALFSSNRFFRKKSILGKKTWKIQRVVQRVRGGEKRSKNYTWMFLFVSARFKTTHPWGGAPDTDTNTDTDPYGHASWVMGHASTSQPYGLRYTRTELSTLSIPCVAYVLRVQMVLP